MTSEELRSAGLVYEVTGEVAVVTLDRPEVRNAQTPAMWRGLAAIGEQVADEVRVVVVRRPRGVAGRLTALLAQVRSPRRPARVR